MCTTFLDVSLEHNSLKACLLNGVTVHNSDRLLRGMNKSDENIPSCIAYEKKILGSLNVFGRILVQLLYDQNE